MKNGRKPTVNKENGELFETVFGKDMKDKNVEYSDKKEHIKDMFIVYHIEKV